MEIVGTGRLERIKSERTEDVVTAGLLQTIYGVGKSFFHFERVERILTDVKDRVRHTAGTTWVSGL